MNRETIDRIERIANDKFDAVEQYYEEGSDEGKQAWKESMDAIDQIKDIDEKEANRKLKELELNIKEKELILKEQELKQSKREKYVNWIIKVVEVAAIPVAICLINNKAKRDALTIVNDYERGGDMYLSTGGRVIAPNSIK